MLPNALPRNYLGNPDVSWVLISCRSTDMISAALQQLRRPFWGSHVWLHFGGTLPKGGGYDVQAVPVVVTSIRFDRRAVAEWKTRPHTSRRKLVATQKSNSSKFKFQKRMQLPSTRLPARAPCSSTLLCRCPAQSAPQVHRKKYRFTALDLRCGYTRKRQ